jgi:hypothetical protein
MLWVAGSDVPRAPRLYVAAHGRCRRCCRLTRLASGEMWRQLWLRTAATTALAGVPVEKGGEGLEKGLANYFRVIGGRARGGLGKTREDVRAVRADANSAQICTKDGSSRTRRSECIAPLRGRMLHLDPFGPVRTRAETVRLPWKCSKIDRLIRTLRRQID